MSNNKQSSIEWLIEQLKEYDFSNEDDTYVIKIQSWVLTEKQEQAKAMHHKEVVDFVEDWYCNGPLLGGGVDVVATIEEHYNETFGGNNEQLHRK